MILTFIVSLSRFLVLFVMLWSNLVFRGTHRSWSPQRPRSKHRQSSLGTGSQPQSDRILRCLLPLERYLGRHHSLSLGNQVAFRAVTVLKSAVPFVTLQPGDHSMVPAPGTFRFPGTLFGQWIQRSW